MNSNWKLLSAGLLVAVLALAGCGGGSSDDMTPPPPPPPPTPEEECLAGDGVVYEDGVCKTADDLRQEGRDDEARRAEEEQAQKDRAALGKKLRGYLSVTEVAAITTAPATTTPSADVVAALAKARNAADGAGKNNDAYVMVYNNKGSRVEISALPTGEDLTDISTLMTKYIMGADFATGSAELKSHDVGDVVRGSYRGANGGYTCGTGTACTSQMTNNGIQLFGTWTFDVDAGQKYYTDDPDHVEYGWWVEELATFDPATTGRAGAWYVVTEDAATTEAQVTAASGTATYNGQAAGQAAFYHILAGDGNIGGAFTADAELTANFDTNMLGGSITDFDINGVDPGWSVELMNHAIAVTGIAVGTATAQTKWTADGVTDEARGSWSAQFYDVPAKEHQPKGVAGGFEAVYESDGFMVGTFEAER